MSNPLTIGLVVNPIAGVGAALAWKGTDDVEAAWDAIEAGKPQPVWSLVSRALGSIPSHIKVRWLLAGDYPIAIQGQVVSTLPPRSVADDTIRAVRDLEQHAPDLILFAGGDGTSADVASSTQLPILGIPAGVKIFSPVFLHRPEDLGQFLSNWEGDTTEVDVLDLDEEAYRQGRAVPKLVTSARIPVSSVIQAGKISWNAPDTETYSLIAERIEDEGWLKGTIFVGAGSTMKSVFSHLGMELSLLGIDVVEGGELVLVDATREQLEKYRPDQIWLSPIGHQGHIFGRGNRQISPSLIRTAELKVFASLEKARETETLYVDTGDPELDDKLRGFVPVVVGYHEEIMKRVR